MKNKIAHLLDGNTKEPICGEKNPEIILNGEIGEACWPCGELYFFMLMNTDSDQDMPGVIDFTC